jgi:NAD(P)-dependent dehydrogenase (short-subunit alcohol dehydrogenase family)
MPASSRFAAATLLPGRIDCFFGCAGISAAYLGRTFSPVHVNLVNFVGPRHLIEILVERMPKNGAIALIASMSGKCMAGQAGQDR